MQALVLACVGDFCEEYSKPNVPASLARGQSMDFRCADRDGQADG